MKKFADTPFLPTEVEIEAISDNEAKILHIHLKVVLQLH